VNDVYCFHHPASGDFWIGTGNSYGDIFQANYKYTTVGATLTGPNWVYDVISFDNQLWAGTGTSTGRIWKSTDNGTNWQGLPNVPWHNTYTLAAAGQNVYAGTDSLGNVYVTYNNGNTWQATYDLLNASRVYCLRPTRTVVPGRNLLLAGTGDSYGDIFVSDSAGGIKPISIIAPAGVIPVGSSVAPKVVVQNFSWKEDTAVVRFRIFTVYSDSVTNITLSPGEIDTVTFSLWQPTQTASYISRCSTYSAGRLIRSEKQGTVSVSSGTGPEVYSLSPSEAPNAGPHTINITGARFVNGITAKLKKQWQSDIIADSIQFISSQEINAKFDLTNAASGAWDLKITNPNGDTYYFYQGFNIIEFPGRQIPYDSWVRFDVQQRDSIEIGVTVPSGISNMFVLLKKTTHYSHHSTWSGSIRVFKDGNQKASAYGEIDYGIHIKNPQSGWHILKIRNDDYSYRGEGYVKVCAKLDTLVFGEWRLGQVLRGWGNDWLQFDVPSGQDTLYLQTDGFGIHSTIDLYKDSLGSTQNHWFFGEGYHIVGHVANPPAGRYYIKYLDSDNVVGETSQVREYLIRASLDSVALPPVSNLTITGLSTYRGGTAGPVTVMVSGTGLDTAATVSLVRSGYPTVTAHDVIGDTNRRTLWATFDLSSAAPGYWTFKVRNPNGDSASATRSFEVVNGGAAQLNVEILGRDVIRVGRWSTYIVRFSNTGNVDALSVVLNTIIPDSIESRILIDRHLPAGMPQESIPTYEADESLRVYSVTTPRLRPGRLVEVPFSIMIPPSRRLAVGTPLRNVMPIRISLMQSGLLEIIAGLLGGYHDEAAALTTRDVYQDYLWERQKRDDKPFNQWEPNDQEWFFREVYMPVYRDHFRAILPTVKDAWVTTAQDALGTFLGHLGEAMDVVYLGLSLFRYKLLNAWKCGITIRNEYKADFWLFSEMAKKEMQGVWSSTPEDKYGSVGYDLPGTPSSSLKRFIKADGASSYRIDFWNSESASAPAQEVFIKDTLDTDFVDSTFNFTEFGFLRWTVPLPGGQYFNTYVDMRPDDSLIVNVEGTYEPNSREISWTFRSLDLVTMQPPEDPMAGFLPPIDSTGYQIGWVNFTAEPYHNLPTGKQITNQSYVKFDVGPWKPAPESAPYLNTIDTGRPSSFVRPLTDTTATGEFVVRWTGQDDSLGSGIHSYDIYVKTNNGPFIPWLTGTTDTVATFVGRNESRHYFYSIATDNVGWVELAPDSFDTRTFVTGIAPPIYLSPEDNAILTDATPTFIWTATAGTQGTYRLQYSKDSSFVQGVVTISGLTDTTYTIPDTAGLKATLYFWRAEAISRLGAHSGYRNPFRFWVDANAPEIPILISPKDDTIINDPTPTFIWSSTAGDSGRYLLLYSIDSLFDSLIGGSLTYDTTYTVSGTHPLSDTAYFWRVKAMDKVGNNSGYQVHPFKFTVSELCEISGKTKYYTNQNPVKNTNMVLSGAIIDTMVTDSTGFYQFTGLTSLQNYMVRPSKANSTRQNAVSSYDAALILRHVVGMITLDSLKRIAADVSGNGQITSYDAALVLRYVVGMIQHFPVGDWRFRPESLFYQPLTANQLNQDYRAILYGDPSGNWSPPPYNFSDGAQAPDFKTMFLTDGKPINSFFLNLPETEATEKRVTTDLPTEATAQAGNTEVTEKKSRERQSTLPLIPSHQGRGNGEVFSHQMSGENSAGVSSPQVAFPVEVKGVKGLYSADIQVSYNPRQLRPIALRNTEITKGFMMAGADYGGIIRIGLAGCNKLDGDLKLLEIVFEVVNQTNESELSELKNKDVASSDLNYANSSNIKIDWLIVNEGSEKPIADGTMGEETKLPTQFYLASPKPNPFGKGTRISYDLPKTSDVRIGVFDISGSLVKTLVETSQPAGCFSVIWDGKDNQNCKLANGIYFIRMQAGELKFQRKAILLKQ
jgi:hypothetical protein